MLLLINKFIHCSMQTKFLPVSFIFLFCCFSYIGSDYYDSTNQRWRLRDGLHPEFRRTKRTTVYFKPFGQTRNKVRRFYSTFCFSWFSGITNNTVIIHWEPSEPYANAIKNDKKIMRCTSTRLRLFK